jgi:hypothetical protein
MSATVSSAVAKLSSAQWGYPFLLYAATRACYRLAALWSLFDHWLERDVAATVVLVAAWFLVQIVVVGCFIRTIRQLASVLGSLFGLAVAWWLGWSRAVRIGSSRLGLSRCSCRGTLFLLATARSGLANERWSLLIWSVCVTWILRIVLRLVRLRVGRREVRCGIRPPRASTASRCAAFEDFACFFTG